MGVHPLLPLVYLAVCLPSNVWRKLRNEVEEGPKPVEEDVKELYKAC